ncbi:MAG: hypothetical protein GYA24_07635 [Candidatus Lokiarchaeota archaeon]|nr:hypothetical protein [Candidatus Lokiarchaeota archaeon]
MKRYASIDFLRGLAIFLMIVLHVISDSLDIDGILADINTVPLMNVIALVVISFLGGLAGLFLAVSAIGNMISMMKFLQAGKPVKDLIIKQVAGGVILLVFAVLSEGVIGYHGAFGEIFNNLHDLPAYTGEVFFSGGFRFETIHTIAWCVILNGLVQGILVKVYGIEQPGKIIKAYITMAIVVLVATPFLWNVLFNVMGPGFPYGTTPFARTEPDLRNANFVEVVTVFFANVIAGKPEPVFPYLATSFFGSIIGIVLSLPREKIPRDFPKKVLLIAFVMFIVGVSGLVINIVMMMEYDAAAALKLYAFLWDHRLWVNEAMRVKDPAFLVFPDYLPVLGWLFQFLALNGVSLAAIMLIVRVVEFRGNGKDFATKTSFIRRFGFVAFTIYNIQFVYFIVRFLVTTFLYGNPYVRMDWGGTFLTLALALALFHLIMIAWERVNYIGSIEWMIGTIAAYVIPGRKNESPWYRKGELDVKNAFYDAGWLNVVEKVEIRHDNLEESKLAYFLSGWGFLFPPLSIICLALSNSARKPESTNKFNKGARITSIIVIVFLITWVTVASLFSLGELGIAL